MVAIRAFPFVFSVIFLFFLVYFIVEAALLARLAALAAVAVPAVWVEKSLVFKQFAIYYWAFIIFIDNLSLLEAAEFIAADSYDLLFSRQRRQ